MTGHELCGFNHVIPGEGPVPSRLMFIGEAGGQEEEWHSRPFVGKSGNRLNKTIEQFLGLKREQVYVTNVFKHHPPGNRKPSKKEITACLPNLLQELRAVQPEVVVLVGATALSTLCPGRKVSRYHGLAWQEAEGALAGRAVVAWYHPTAGMRSPKVVHAILEDAKAFWGNVEGAGASNGSKLDLRLGTGDQALLSVLAEPVFAFDLETTSWKQGRMSRFGEIVGYSVAASGASGIYVGGGLEGSTGPSSGMAGLLSDPDRTKLCHNVKFEYSRLAEAGITLRGFEDTRGMAYLLGVKDTTLKDLARRELGREPVTFDEATDGVDTRDAGALRDVLVQHYEYGAADAANTFAVWERLSKRIKEYDLERVYREIELPLVPVLADIETQGIVVDVARVTKETGLLGNEINTAERAVYAAAGREFNIRSNQQKSQLLEELGAPVTKRTDTGLYATDKRTLLGLRNWSPDLIDSLLLHGEFTKLQQFLQSFLALRWEDGRLHPQYNQFGHEEAGDEEDSGAAPATGRLSSSFPNIQQIPNHRNPEWGRKVRSCLLPLPGYLWLRCDFAQEEPRVLALLSQDRQLLGDFIAGVDVYAPAATSLYGYPVTKVMEERQAGKGFFLLWMYGGGAEKAVGFDPKRLTITAAEQGIARLRGRYWGIVDYWTRQRVFAQEHGYVQTLFGRKRWLPEIYSKDPETFAAAARQAANTPVQGTCGDVMKLMLIRVAARLDPAQAHIVATVHDELDIAVKPCYAEEAKAIVADEASRVLPGMALPIEFKIGETWGDVT